MLEKTEENVKLILKHREYCDKARNAIDEEEKTHYQKLVEETRNEMFIREFGDRNYGRFNKY